MKILLVGGGTSGPVAPLLAIAEEIKKEHPQAKFLFIGTKKGPERLMAEQAKIKFISIPAGKWRRYFSLKNFLTPLLVSAGFLKSFGILRQFRPACVVGAGGFVQVPVMWAAWFLRIPVVFHQQDLVPSLANILCQPVASKITVTFEDSLTDFTTSFGLFYKKQPDKIIWTGNPFRHKLAEATREESMKAFHLKPDLPTLFVFGGGTGAAFLNKLIGVSLPQLSKAVQIIHSTGKDRSSGNMDSENYHPYEFISNVGQAYAAADIVLCRAGLSTITELSNLKKLAIIVPMPGSHQEMNAFLMHQQKAAVVVPQKNMNADVLIRLVRRLLFEHQLQQELKKNVANIMPKDAGKKIAGVIIKEALK